MSGDDYGNKRFGRGGGGGGGDFGSGGRRGGGRGYGGSERGRSNYDSNERRDNYGNRKNYEEKEDDWDDQSTSDNNYASGSAYGRGSRGGRYGTTSTRSGGENTEGQSDDDSYRGEGRGAGRMSGRNDGDRSNKKISFGRGVDKFGDDNRRGGGRGMGGRGGNTNNSNSGNSYRRKNDYDEDDDGSPSRMRGRKYGDGGGGDEKNEEDKDDKPRERYIPPEPTDDEEVMFASGITSGINFAKYENIRVKISGDNSVPPIKKFEEAGLRELVYKNVLKSGYAVPTPIQKYALPTIMMGRDLMACAQTGSGKTAAFLIPIINTLLENPSDLIITSNSVEPQAIIMSPTRELTIQIFNEARKFAHGSIIKVALAYGGTAAFHQASILMRGCHILVATPGRLNDFVSRGKITFSSVRFFVLDEADRMLDMGFKPEIEKMLLHTTMVPVGKRQTMMFSATFPEDIQRMAQDYLHDYLFVAVGIVGGACADVEQTFYEIAQFDKKEKLKEILSQADGKEKTLVFVEQKRNADFIAALLSENNFPTTSIHGDRLQSQREMALNDFKTGRMPTLVATAVAARGLDIKNVSHVINYDLPSTIEEYVHRIGRTGRVGNRGRATSFYDSNKDAAIASALVTVLEQTNQKVPDFLSGNAYERKSKDNGFGDDDNQDFGGRDVRRGGMQKSYRTPPTTLEEEEEW